MMRELRFRYWDEWGKKLVLFTLADIANGFDEGYSMMCLPNTASWAEGSEPQLEDAIIEQFTGLTDKRGKDIYEGDIVIFDNTKIGGGRWTGEVIWNSDQSLGGLEWGLQTKTGYLHTDFLGELEVIGNIHELLEKQCEDT